MAEADIPGNKRKKRAALALFSFFLAAGLVVLYFYTRYIRTHISTDDAFVENNIYTIAPRVSGTVLKVNVADNQPVKAGDVLVELDPELFVQAVKESQAALNMEGKRVLEIQATIRAQEKKVIAAEATLKKTITEKDELIAAVKSRKADVDAKKALLFQAETDFKRVEELIKGGYVPQARYDQAKTDYKTAEAALKAAEEALRQSELSVHAEDSAIAETGAILNSQKATLEQLRASVKTQEEMVRTRATQAETARINMSYTKIYAPADGYVTKKNAEAGNIVESGTPLMALVPSKGAYVVANYKETEIHAIKPGQKAEIRVDTYPGAVFHGHVDSLMAGTGAAFSLFPPENATGNYVKVVQRVPVKILIDDGADPAHPLRVGMSVVPTVLVK